MQTFNLRFCLRSYLSNHVHCDLQCFEISDYHLYKKALKKVLELEICHYDHQCWMEAVARDTLENIALIFVSGGLEELAATLNPAKKRKYFLCQTEVL